MGERVRSGLFNTLGDISELEVLDAFAGSGALSIEAISRGAKRSTAIEIDRRAQAVIARNILTLNVGDKVKLIKSSASAWLSTSADSFDIVLLDPPYNDLQSSLLIKLAERVQINGVVVISLPPKAHLDLPSNFSSLAAKDYGDATLRFYRRLS